MDLPAVERALRCSRPQTLVRISPSFSRDFFDIVLNYAGTPTSSEMAFRNAFLWGNKFLRGKVKKKIETFWRRLDIMKINHLLHLGHFMSEAQFTEVYNCPPIPGILQSLAHFIPRDWLTGLSLLNKFLPNRSLYLKNPKKDRKSIQSVNQNNLYSIPE